MWKNILVAALSALFTFAGSYYFYSESLAISKLDLHKDYDDNYFSKPKFPSDDIILTVNRIEKEKIGLLKISLLNYTAKDYLDIPINFKLTPKKLSNFKVLAYSVVGHGDVNDLVKEPKKWNLMVTRLISPSKFQPSIGLKNQTTVFNLEFYLKVQRNQALELLLKELE